MELDLHGDLCGGDLGVVAFLVRLAGKNDLGIAARCWRVVSEDIERIGAGMKTAVAGLDGSVMLERFPYFELEFTALQTGVEALESDDVGHWIVS